MAFQTINCWSIRSIRRQCVTMVLDQQRQLAKRNFNHFFLPPDYYTRLEEEISRKQQQPDENDYVIALQIVIRRMLTMDAERSLHWLHQNANSSSLEKVSETLMTCWSKLKNLKTRYYSVTGITICRSRSLIPCQLPLLHRTIQIILTHVLQTT